MSVPLNSRMDSVVAQQNVEAHFSKLFRFSNTRHYVAPDAGQLFKNEKWKVDELEVLKSELNACKSKLNNYNLEEWHSHTKFTNYAGDIIKSLRSFKLEFLTQAWCKFYDILVKNDIIPPEIYINKIFNSVHLCEAPGAFIAALNHFLKLNLPIIKWDWIASTLNPYYEGNSLEYMISDDRFMLKTMHHWWFGADLTGNICDKNNIKDLIRTSERLEPIYLVTCDGSVDCTSEPAEQEAKVVQLHYCEAVAALNILDIGGTLVLKIFTIFESDTVNLIYLLRCCFEQINVYKPVASKEGNSEVYLICLKYKGKYCIYSILETLTENVEYVQSATTLFSRNQIPDDFMAEIINCATFFKNIQVSVIERNISLFENTFTPKDRAVLKKTKQMVADKFIYELDIQSIPPNFFAGGPSDVPQITRNYSSRDESGTYSERQLQKNLDDVSLLLSLEQQLEKIHLEWGLEEIRWVQQSPFLEMEVNSCLTLPFGKPVRTILSTKFCSPTITTIFYTVVSKFGGFVTSSTNSDITDLKNMLESKYRILGENLSFLDCGHLDWYTNHCGSQKLFLEYLITNLLSMRMKGSLLIRGFPPLSLFNVGILFVVSTCFKTIGFLDPSVHGYCLVLKEKSDHRVPMECFKRALFEMSGEENKSIHSLLPINVLSYNPWLLDVISLFNQIAIKKKSLEIITRAKESSNCESCQ